MFLTKKYQGWWSKVTISDLRANVDFLKKSAGYDLSKSKKNTQGQVLEDGSDFEDQDSDAEQTGKSSDVYIANRGDDIVENDNSEWDS